MKIIEKILRLENPYWKVWQTYIEDSLGRKGDVISLEGAKSTSGVIILPITKDKQIICSNEYKYGPGKEILTLPGGFVEKNKTPIEQAKEELLEETGYKTDEELIFLGKYIQHHYVAGEVFLFLAKNCYKLSKQNTHELEEVKVNIASIDRFDKLIQENKIICPWSNLAYRISKEKTNNFTNI